MEFIHLPLKLYSKRCRSPKRLYLRLMVEIQKKSNDLLARRRDKREGEKNAVLEHICFPYIRIMIFLAYYMLMNLFGPCALPCGEKEQIVFLAQQMVGAVLQARLVRVHCVIHAQIFSLLNKP